MSEMSGRSAVVVGAGPNGLVAAIALARAGWDVTVFEAGARPGGGTRTEELTLPGVLHDVCSAIHPLAVGSPAFREIADSDLPLRDHGLEWIQSDVPLAHPLDGGRAAVLHRSVDETVDGLGADGTAYLRLVEPVVDDWGRLASRGLLGPMTRLPRHPIAWHASGLEHSPRRRGWRRGVRHRRGPRPARGRGGPCDRQPLGRPLTGAAATRARGNRAHRRLAGRRGGLRSTRRSARRLPALARRLDRVRSRGAIDVRPPPTPCCSARHHPGQLASIAESAIGVSFANRLRRFRHGPGAFKIDYTLGGPVPWTSEAAPVGRDGPCRRHLRGGRRRGVRRGRRPPSRATVRARRSAERGRPDSRSGRLRTPCGPTAMCPPVRQST